MEGYSLIQIAVEIGGLCSFIFAGLRIITRLVARIEFIGSMIESIFRVRTNLSREDQIDVS